MSHTLNSIPVFHRPEMVVPDVRSFSPSAAKPAVVLQDWVQVGLPIEMKSFDPVDAELLSLAHDPAYVAGVLSGNVPNGFGNRMKAVADSLRYTSGAMLAAAREALANGQVACAPVSGFHHAGYAQGHGFCTFNGLVVTAQALRRDGTVGPGGKVAIVDLDQHWGDGTHDIVQRLRLDWIEHHSPAADVNGRRDARAYLDRLPGVISGLRDCDLILYQAGADAHMNDPLGGWMTTEEIAERDRLVFETAATFGIPVAWNLAGGYQREADGSIAPVPTLHRQTMQACCTAYLLTTDAGSQAPRGQEVSA